MAEISDWRLTELKEHEKSYYELQKEKDDLCSALTPIFQQLLENIDYETLYKLKKDMDQACLCYE